MILWSERVLKAVDKDDLGWPDIYIEGKNRHLYLEVERTRKTKPMEHFFFLKKLQRYQSDDSDTVVLFEKITQAQKFIDQLKVAQEFGINSWTKDPYSREFKENIHQDREIFELKLQILIWDHNSKKPIDAIFHNC